MGDVCCYDFVCLFVLIKIKHLECFFFYSVGDVVAQCFVTQVLIEVLTRCTVVAAALQAESPVPEPAGSEPQAPTQTPPAAAPAPAPAAATAPPAGPAPEPGSSLDFFQSDPFTDSERNEHSQTHIAVL